MALFPLLLAGSIAVTPPASAEAPPPAQAVHPALWVVKDSDTTIIAVTVSVWWPEPATCMETRLPAPRSLCAKPRTATKAAAWAVPAVAVAAAVPIASASVPCVAVTAGGSGCKWPGSGNNWSYDLQFCYQNNCGKSVQVRITSITNNSGKAFTACTSDTHIELIVTELPLSSAASNNVTEFSANLEMQYAG